MQLNLSKISDPASHIPHPVSITNLIFDFGGVICNIDVRRTEKRFVELGFKTNTDGSLIPASLKLFGDIESGVLSPQQFRDELKKYFSGPVTDEQIDEAWNALLLDIPEPRIRLLEELRREYRIFLLSNTNEIHYRCYLEKFRQQYGYRDFDALFEKAYFSYRIGLKKPAPEIFRYVLNDGMMEPSETLFIDDTVIHVEAARNAGIHAHLLKIEKGEEITDLFQKTFDK
jgi:putative hydrolase of the HAD superfamily